MQLLSCRTSLQKSYYNSRMEEVTSGSSKNWWSALTSLTGCSKTSSSPLKCLANSVCNGDLNKLANKINNLFQPVSAHLPPLSPDSEFLQHEEGIFPDQYIIRVEELEESLSHLQTSKVTGPAAPPAWILRDFA